MRFLSYCLNGQLAAVGVMVELCCRPMGFPKEKEQIITLARICTYIFKDHDYFFQFLVKILLTKNFIQIK